MRKLTIVSLVVAAAVAIPMVVLATTGSGGSRLACQKFAFTTNSASTSSNAFSAVPGLRTRALIGEAYAVQVSATFRGAPARLRLMDTSVGGTFPMRPGVATE